MKKMLTGVLIGAILFTTQGVFLGGTNVAEAKRVNGRTGHLVTQKNNEVPEKNVDINIQERASHYVSIAGSGGGVNPWEYMGRYGVYEVYRNPITGQWRVNQYIGTADQVFKIIGNGWGSAGAPAPERPMIGSF